MTDTTATAPAPDDDWDDDDQPLGIISDEAFDKMSVREQMEYLAIVRALADEWELTPAQQLAENLAHECDELLAGGAAGGGKSDWLLYHLYHLSLNHPGHQSLIIRRTFPMLRRSVVRRSLEVFDPADGCRWRATDKEWRFDNGSIIEFGYCEQEDDVHQYLSAQYDCIAVDEATELTEYQWTMLRSRCRTRTSKRRDGVRPHMVACSNPGRISHRFFKTRFVDEHDHEADGRHVTHVERRAENGVDRTVSVTKTEIIRDIHGRVLMRGGQPRVRTLGFVPFLVSDNPHQDQDYISNLMSLPEIEQRMYLYGDWGVFKGQFFAEWDPRYHVVSPFAIPESWPRFRGYDHGYRDPACMVWIAVDPEGFLVVYREMWVEGQNVPELAATIQALNGDDRVDYTMADPSIFRQVGGKGGTIAQQFRDEKVRLRQANNDRASGWSMVRKFLKVHRGVRPPQWAIDAGCAGINPDAPDDPEGWASPGIFFFSNLTNGLRAMPDMIFDQNKPEDMAKHPDDHWPDPLRYALMSRPRPATLEPRKNKPLPMSPDWIAERVRQQVGIGLRGRRRGVILGDP